jgi:hypothetical protein
LGKNMLADYEAPQIETLSDEQILEELGEAQANLQYLPNLVDI